MTEPRRGATFESDFGPFEGKVWLDVANQGPMPKAGAAAAILTIEAKIAPHRLCQESFTEVPDRLRGLLACIVGGSPAEVFLGNSTSYGLHVLANCIQWEPGDEVLVDPDDFPANIFPWLCLQKQGILVRYLEKRGRNLSPEDVRASMSKATRLFCASWVNSFTGFRMDVESISEICREHDVLFVLNGSQLLGTRPVDLSGLAVDAFVSCGYKWLCGPYGTGFCWVHPRLFGELTNRQAYWLRLGKPPPILPADISEQIQSASGYDVFCPGNFFNFTPWTATIQYLCEIGFSTIWSHNDSLISEFFQTLDRQKFRVLSSEDPDKWSSIIVLSHLERERNPEVLGRLRDTGIFIAKRRGNLRISPHIHNTSEDIKRVVDALNAY